MVLLVPDDAEDITQGVQPKAQLDNSEANKATQKVDLDLDDAPFLEDEDEEEEAPIAHDETPLFEQSAPKRQFDFGALFKNRLFLLALGVILLLLAVILYLLFREPAVPALPPPPPRDAPAATPTEAAQTPEILIRLDPFLIEQRDKDNVIRFLEVRVIVSTLDDGLARQFKQDTYTVRNAIFYYLKNKDLQFLSDKKNSDKLKQELLAIINQYMGFGQFDTILFEQYLVR
ncbi:MAG: flagellar basal body-associated FliL family protein [Pseudomonadota bacterium]